MIQIFTQGNSFNMQMWHDLRAAFHTAGGDSSVRSIVLTGDSKSFSTGMDLSVFMDMQKLAMKVRAYMFVDIDMILYVHICVYIYYACINTILY
jgi:enoyl-CoA hydratase/carnithine racemase